jgi:tripartite-type tricarboxylate transporter receptor subunit TctC
MQCRLLTLLAAVMSLSTGAAAAETSSSHWPSRPVHVVVPYAAGGIADITVRLIADRLGDSLGERFIIDNQPGAGGIAAARAALGAPADGYTLILFTNGTALNVPLYKKLPYDPVKEFVPVAGFSEFDLTLVTGAATPYATLGDFLKDARASPGKLNIGTINVGSTQNLGAELLKKMAGVDATIVPYRTTPDIMVALERNDVQLGVEYYATTRPQIEDGKLRLLATTGEKRSPLTPDASTVAEAGVPGYEVGSWNALFAKAGTPQDIIARINAAAREAVAQPDTARRMSELGLVPRAGPPEEMAARLSSDIAKWTKVINDAHIPKL